MSFGELWKNASGETIEPPKGNYKVRIVRGQANLSNAGDAKANVIVEIIDGELAGSQIDHFMWMAHEVSAAINKEALLMYGLSDPDGIESIEDLDDRIQKLIGNEAEIGVSYKDGRMNIKVNRSWTNESDIPSDNGQAPAASFATAAGPDDDDSLPF